MDKVSDVTLEVSLHLYNEVKYECGVTWGADHHFQNYGSLVHSGLEGT